MDRDNVIPFRPRPGRDAEQLSRAEKKAPELHTIATIENMERIAIMAMNRLVQHWNSNDKAISDAASSAITRIVEVTQSPPHRPEPPEAG
ncbi:MAG: hypothetical protein JWN33_278 [Candidatus Saccharibacteria bacterium]|nr:hypothetical protein [Candidatus Saccharibacteria bacterium]